MLSNSAKAAFDLHRRVGMFDADCLYEQKQEAHYKVGLGETSRRIIRQLCQYSSREKYEDVFDAAVHLSFALSRTNTSSTFVLLVDGVLWKVKGRPPTSTPVESKLVGGQAENL